MSQTASSTCDRKWTSRSSWFCGATCFLLGATMALISVTSTEFANFSRAIVERDKDARWEGGELNGLSTTSGKNSSSCSPTPPTSSTASKPPPPGFCRTSSTGYEILLESLLGSFFQEVDFLPEGSVLDVGAQFGEMACRFASLAPDRRVHALDPSKSQCDKIRSKFGAHLPNLQVTNVGIGQNVGKAKVDGPEFTGMNIGDEFVVETLDHLFFEQSEPLGFAHIDVEGRELDVLKGGNNTILTYQPIFTAEVRVHQDPKYSKELLDYINELGYDPYVVDEPCGWPHMDYRNLINFPRSRMNKLEFSDTFNLAVSTEAIFYVNSKTIFEKVYPCCALGGECCPFNSTNDKDCCREKTMRRWHNNNNNVKPVAMQGFTYSRRHVHRLWAGLRQRVGLTPEQAVS